MQSIEQECLDHFIIFGAAHMDVLCREYLAYYLRDRPHQGRENELLIPAPKPKKRSAKSQPDNLPKLSHIRCRSRLGGLLKSYHRHAA